jgi:hypothetical protein
MIPVFYAVNQWEDEAFVSDIELLTFRLVLDKEQGIHLVLGFLGFAICIGVDYD